jgi:hypothetical protein
MRRAGLSVLLILGFAAAASADSTCGPDLDVNLQARVDTLERQVNAALAASPAERARMTEMAQSELRRLRGSLRTLEPRQRRAARRALGRLRVPLAALGLERAVKSLHLAPVRMSVAVAGTGAVAGFVGDLMDVPIAGASVSVVRMRCGSALPVETIFTDASGAYATSSTLEAGTYYVYAQAAGYVGAIYSGYQCSGSCAAVDAIGGGTPIAVASSTVSGIDIPLTPGGQISGTVTGAGATPLENVLVDTYDLSTGRWSMSATTDASGAYTVGSLPSGNYTVYADGEVYGSGAPVAVTAGATMSGIDFSLPTGGPGWISGTVSPADDSIYIDFINAAGGYEGYAIADGMGAYVSSPLEEGMYYVVAFPSELYMDRPYGGASCFDGWSCRTTGTLVGVTAGDTTTEINIALEVGGHIEGTLIGSLFGDVCGEIDVSDGTGFSYGWGCGAYSTPAKLPTGSYYVWAASYDGGWIPQLYNGIQCLQCDWSTGTAVPVTQGLAKTGVDFTLPAGSEISGNVWANDGSYVSTAYVDIYDSSGYYVTYGYAYGYTYGYGCSGSWMAWYGLPAGNYYARAEGGWANPRDYRPQIYSGIDGWSRSATSGTPIAVDGTTDATGIDFGLVPWMRRQDMNEDRRADILWRHSGGDNYAWLMNGTTLTASGFLPSTGLDWEVQGLGDFNGDGTADLLWRHTTGLTYLWFMDGVRRIGQGFTNTGADTSWTIQGTGDLDGDGRQDVVWRHSDGSIYVWLMQGLAPKLGGFLESVGADWQLVRLADFNGDARDDILWRHDSGRTYVWFMDGTSIIARGFTSADADLTWAVSGAGDLDGNGVDDILWRHGSGSTYAWLMQGTTVTAGSGFLPGVSTAWDIEGVRDFNQDGRADILWRETTLGWTYIWFMNGVTRTGEGFTEGRANMDWTIQGR